MTYQYSYETMLGSVTLVEEDGALLAISTHRSWEGIVQETPLIKEAYRQLNEYLQENRKTFDLPLRMKGTDFGLPIASAICL